MGSRTAVNEALRAHRRRDLERRMIEGYKAMASDKKLAEDLKLWDTTLLDGFDALRSG